MFDTEPTFLARPAKDGHCPAVHGGPLEIALAVFCGLGFALIALVFAVLVIRARARARVAPVLAALRSHPVRPCGGLGPGQVVRVVGTVELADEAPLPAPVHGRPCVAYWIDVFERSPRHRWDVWHEHRAVRFRVRDETGAVIVEPGSRFGCVLRRDPEVGVGTGPRLDALPQLAPFLTSRGAPVTPRLPFNTFSAFLGCLEPGGRVAVVGQVRGAPRGPYASPGALVLGPTAEGALQLGSVPEALD